MYPIGPSNISYTTEIGSKDPSSGLSILAVSALCDSRVCNGPFCCCLIYAVYSIQAKMVFGIENLGATCFVSVMLQVGETDPHIDRYAT